MLRSVSAFLQYLILFSLAGLLIWLALRNLNPAGDQNRWQFIWATWKGADKYWLFLMAALALLSHWLRAIRWRMLLIPTGHRISTSASLLSLMVGYLVNLAVPRGGELSRCYNLSKLEQTPIEVSFGTVVAERVIDLLCLVILIIVSLAVEWSRLSPFLGQLLEEAEPGSTKVPPWFWVGVFLMAVASAVLWRFRRHPKVVSTWAGFRQGILAVFRLSHPVLFIVHSVTIWGLYFLMSYCVLQAFPETKNLDWDAVLGLFAIGSIAMAVPLPGGAGSYHVLVPLGLTTLYAVPDDEAIAFTFVFHGWQTFIMIVGGVVSLLISYGMTRWKRQPTRSGI
jgi:uncharacterized membrane protein YbhN (UPF0104 family)